MSENNFSEIPQNVEAEKAILGAIIVGNDETERVFERLKASDFYDLRNQQIFRAVKKIWRSGKPLDHIAIAHWAKTQNQLSNLVEVSDLGKVVHGIPPNYHIESSLEIVREISRKRSALRMAGNFLANAQDADDFDDLLNRYAENIGKISKQSSDVSAIGCTFGELSALDLLPREEIIFGLGRGEFGILNAINNVGKTTLLRNLMVSLCTGKPFPPFGNFNLPKRVAFLDFEDNLPFLRSDLSKMIAGFSDADKARLNDNALLICDVRINDEDLSLSNSFHLFSITNRLKSFAPDLIIIDTISSAFQIRDENSNAEVRNFITRPLKALAKDCNTALLAAHHIGKAKSEDGQIRESSHKGRGASSFADMSRLVLNFEKDAIDDTVKLICAKVKGAKFTDLKLKFDLESRWFEAIGEYREVTNYSLLMETFSDGNDYSTKEIVQEFDGIMSERLIKFE